MRARLERPGPVADGAGPGPVTSTSDALEDRGDALAAADAHRDERVPAAGAPELVQRLDGQDGPGGGDGVPEGDAAAVRVGALLRQAQFPDHRQRLRGEGLVDLE